MESNYLSLEDFNKFIMAIPNITPYINDEFRKPPVSALGLMVFCQICFTAALRPIEVFRLQKEDFDFEHRIIYLLKSKTSKGQRDKRKVQKTTISPIYLKCIQDWIERAQDPLFDFTRQTLWKYVKEAGDKAGLDVFSEKRVRDIRGAYPYIFRESYAKIMEDKGAPISLIQLKLRHSHQASVDHYTARSLGELKRWEEDNMKPRLTV